MSAAQATEDPVEAALILLDQAAMEARLHDDPIRVHMLAIAAGIRAQRILNQEHADLYQESAVLFGRHVEQAKQPVQDHQLKSAVVQGISGHAGALLRAIRLQNVLIAATVLVVTILTSFVGGYWWSRGQYIDLPVAFGNAMTGPNATQWLDLIQRNDIAKAKRWCGPQQGGEACSFAFWTRLPPAN